MCILWQVIAKGMAFSEHAYLRSGWNIIDGTLVVISLVDLVISLTASTSPRIFGILRVFRLLRALKPLRCGRVLLQMLRWLNYMDYGLGVWLLRLDLAVLFTPVFHNLAHCIAAVSRAWLEF